MTLKKFLMVGIVAAVLVACGDDDSSDFATRPSGDSSFSSVTPKSSDSETSVSSSSSSAKSSSSSAKSSSSAASSSSKDVEPVETSSSSSSVDSSSSSAKSSSSVAYVEPCRTDSVDTCEYGTLTDERDGQTYKTVKIGTQTWMAENLNYAYTDVPYNFDGYTSDSISWCYDNDPANCTKYGRLYTWAAAMDSVGTWSTNGKGCGNGKKCSPTYPVRGVCPEEWHLPTKAEFETLFAAVGGRLTAGKMLKSTSGWNRSDNGMDAYAFLALPAGFRNNLGHFVNKGYYADFWSSTEDNSSYAYYMDLHYDGGNADLGNYYKYNGFSVRCLKDLQAE